MTEGVFGEIAGYPPGSHFEDRAALSAAGLHRPPMAGIWGTAARGGAQSIVLSGGYEDDEDNGDEIVYTGQGGQKNGVQVADQELTLGNHALAVSQSTGHPVRVIRGYRHDSPFSPASGYRYDGLYRVVDSWRDTGLSGYKVWRFRMEKVPDAAAGQGAANSDGVGAKPGGEAVGIAEPEDESSRRREAPAGNDAPNRKGSWTTRTVRDTAVSEHVKELHGYKCQVCGEVLETARGRYAEAAHIRPLGRPHNGPDTPDNVLCLCPNHHVLFDHGGFSIHPDSLRLLGIKGVLRQRPDHRLSRDHIRYHLEHYGSQGG